jgi:hypothetical protein
MLQRLAAFFNVSVDCLLNGPGPGEWNINIFWEVDETQALDIKKGEFAVGFRDSGDIMLWGNVPSEKTPDETAERVRIELSIAHEMRLAGKAAREKIEGAAPK